MKRIAIFTSADSFETWFQGVFGLSRETYVNKYRNDWVWEYAIGLAELGHEMVIYVLSRGENELREALPGISVRFVALAWWHRFVDPILYRISSWPGVAELRATFEASAFWRSLAQGLQDDRVDVLYNQEFWTPRFDQLVTHLPLPIVGADHGAIYDGRVKTKQRTLKLAARLICQSQYQLKTIRALGADAAIIPNGVDTEFFCPDVDERERTPAILTVGRLSDRQKRLSDLITSMKHLPEFKLTIVGSGEDEAALRTLVASLNLGPRIEFLGFISDRAHLRQLYRTCGVFTLASAWEAMALAMLEAMSCGAPVAATEIPSFESFIVDGVNGFLAPVGSPERLSEAIRSAFHARRSIGKEARRTVVEHFAAKSVYQKVSQVIQTI
jgi:glycosyltransferase involved in cell wall biosynthesis